MRRVLGCVLAMATAGCGLLTSVDWDRVAVNGDGGLGGNGQNPPGSNPPGNNPPGSMGCKAPAVECLTECCPGNDDPGLPNHIAAGGSTTCVTTTTGMVRCWGDNAQGQLGRGLPVFPSPSRSEKPLSVLRIPTGASQVAVGFSHACAVVGQRLACWGTNSYGELGTGAGPVSTGLPTVADVGGVPTALTAGSFSSCAIVNGAALCWGSNTSYQLAVESGTQRETPQRIGAFESGTTSIAVGKDHACAIQQGSAFCWGNNTTCRLGRCDGPSLTGTPLPVNEFGTAGTVVGLGTYHSCALQGDRLVCWGWNSHGQLGSQSVAGGSQSAKPVVPTGLGSQVVSFCAGEFHTCAVVGDAVKCTGDNQFGELGIDQAKGHQPEPKEVKNLGAGSGALEVACGTYHTCALLKSGKVRCWGYGSHGEMGNGHTDESNNAPVDVIWP